MSGYSSYESRAYGRLYQTYGLTKEAFHKMWDDSNGQCNVCGVGLSCRLVPGSDAEGNKRYCVDHCHDSGEVRGLLCNSCNTAIGYLEKLERKGVMRSAVDYMSKPATGIKNETRESDKQRQIREMDNAMRLMGYHVDDHGRYHKKQYRPRGGETLEQRIDRSEVGSRAAEIRARIASTDKAFRVH